MVELNEQAMSLLNTYPKLAEYMDTSKGYMSFSEEGMQEYANFLYNRSQVALEDYRSAQAEKLQWEFDQLSKNVAKASVNFNKLRLSPSEIEQKRNQLNANTPLQSQAQLRADAERRQPLGTQDAITIIRAFKGNTDLLYDKNDNSDKIIELLKKNNVDLSKYTDKSQREFVQDLKSNAGEISRYTNSIDEYTQKIAEYTKALINSADKPEEATDYEYQAAYRRKKAEVTEDVTNAVNKYKTNVKSDQDLLIQEFLEIKGFGKDAYIGSQNKKGVTIGESKDSAANYT